MSWYFWFIFCPLIDVLGFALGLAERENAGWDMWLISFPIMLMLTGIVFGSLGSWFGTQRNRRQAGFWLGCFFGPSGWLLTLLLPPGTGNRPGDGGKLGTCYPSAERAIAVPPRSTNLMACPDCGNHVSKLAKACPKCGRPVALTPEQRAEQEERERERAAERERLAREEQERERERAERLAAQRQRQHEEELERQREAQRQWEEQKRRWEERKRKALRWGEERSRTALVGLVSVARWLLRRGDRLLRRLTRHRRDVRVLRALVPARWWGWKADRALRGWSSRLATLNEVGMRRCLWLVSAIVLILVLLVGALAMSGGEGKQTEPIRGAEKQDRAIQPTAAAPAGSHRKELTKAQEEQIRLRLQALYAALYSLPSSGPVDQLANVMQQQANLRAEISDLEAQLAGTAEPKGR
jgi:uncharacterized membrane protein YsdA (DUF1294 family)